MNAGSSRVPPQFSEATSSRVGPMALTLLALLGGGVILFAFNPEEHSFYPTCFFHKTTGLLCPGCGALRAAHQLLHGHLAAAFHFNALLVLSLPLLGWCFGRLAVRKLRNEPVTVAIRPAWLWSGLAAVVAFGILRNLPLAPLAWLAH